MIRLVIFLFVISINAKAASPSLSPAQEVVCFKEYVQPYQEQMAKFLDESKKLSAENAKLKATLKKIQGELQSLKKLHQEIQFEISSAN